MFGFWSPLLLSQKSRYRKSKTNCDDKNVWEFESLVIQCFSSSTISWGIKEFHEMIIAKMILARQSYMLLFGGYQILVQKVVECDLSCDGICCIWYAWKSNFSAFSLIFFPKYSSRDKLKFYCILKSVETQTLVHFRTTVICLVWTSFSVTHLLIFLLVHILTHQLLIIIALLLFLITENERI